MGFIKKLINILKSLVLFVGMVVIALFVVVFGFPWWGKTVLNRAFIQTFSKFACFVVGIRKEVIDEHKLLSVRPAIYIGNHQSGFDFALIGSLSPSYGVVVGKREIIYLPVIGWYFKLAGNLMIDRANKEDSRAQMIRLSEYVVKNNLGVAIFPEGTRNKESNEVLLPFKKGAFYMAFAQGLPIVPVVCSSLKNIAVWERLELNGGRVIIKVLDPIPTKGVPMEEMNVFIERVRNLIQTELTALNAQIRSEASK